MLHGIPFWLPLPGAATAKPPAEPRPPNDAGPEFCKTKANPSAPWPMPPSCVNWNWNVVSNPAVTGCFSSNHAAPDRFVRAGVRRTALPDTAASPTNLSPRGDAKSSKRIAAGSIWIALRKKRTIQAERIDLGSVRRFMGAPVNSSDRLTRSATNAGRASFRICAFTAVLYDRVMLRRTFLQTASGLPVIASLAAAPPPQRSIPLGFDTYSLRAFRWKAPQLLEYASSQKLDTIQISSLGDYDSLEPPYLAKIRDKAHGLGIHIDAGIGCICPLSTGWNPKSGDP